MKAPRISILAHPAITNHEITGLIARLFPAIYSTDKYFFTTLMKISKNRLSNIGQIHKQIMTGIKVNSLPNNFSSGKMESKFYIIGNIY